MAPKLCTAKSTRLLSVLAIGLTLSLLRLAYNYVAETLFDKRFDDRFDIELLEVGI